MTPMSPSAMRAISPVGDKYKLPPSSAPASPTTTSTPLVYSKLECDYDKNPTVLYEAIEAKQWDYAINLFAKGEVGDQASTWVVRKETNGKLRWRILPLHAAVIFGSPVRLIEALLENYPEAAQCKDDQGMLPLHLCFRNESTWDIADELLTAYPQAIFVSDRKGRTPLQCAIQMVSSSHSVCSIDPNRPESKAFRSVVNVLDMYSQIVVAAERQKAQQDSRKLAEARICQIQDTHLATLNNLKREWHTQQEESKKQMNKLRAENDYLEETVKAKEAELAVSKSNENNLKEEIRKLNLALNHANNKQKVARQGSHVEGVQRTNEVLRTMIEDMVVQQKAYHTQFRDLMGKYEKLVDERKQLETIFVTKASEQHEKEEMVIENFKKWMHDREKVLGEHSSSLGEEEKKVEDVIDFVQRGTLVPSKMPPLAPPSRPSSIATKGSASDIIDLSHMASPRDDP